MHTFRKPLAWKGKNRRADVTKSQFAHRLSNNMLALGRGSKGKFDLEMLLGFVLPLPSRCESIFV